MKQLNQSFLDHYDLEETCINGIDCYYTCLHLEDDVVPSGMHKYDIRETDDGEPFGTIEKNPVVVNFGGVILTETEIDFGENNYIDINNNF